MTTSWNDCNGQTRELALTFGNARKLRDKLRIDLTKDSDPTTVVGLQGDREKLAEVLFELSDDTDQDAFFDVLDSDALASGWEALAEAFVAFCPAGSRDSVREAIKKQNESIVAANAEIARALSDSAVDAEIERAIAEAGRRAIESFKLACK